MQIDSFQNIISNSNHFTFNGGIYYSNNSTILSYPEGGHDDCFQLEENSFWFNHRNDCLLSLIQRYSPKDVFFDVGGGNGFVSQSLLKNGIQAVLVEPGNHGVLNAAKRKLENIVCGSVEDLNAFTGEVKAAGTFDVIEHIKEDTNFVNQIYNLLAPDGYFYITVPAFQFLWSDEDVDAGHYRRYTLHSISKLLENSGFEIVYKSYFFSFLVFPLFLIRTIPSKLGIRKKSKEQTQNEHNQNAGIIGKIMDKIWKWERRKISTLKSIPFGTSCLIVAKKK